MSDSPMSAAHCVFENHNVRHQGDGIWSLYRSYSDGSWNSTYAVDICCPPQFGQVIVTGDINPMIFAYGPKDPAERVLWLGQPQTGLSYLIEKASIGMGRDGVMKFSWEAAVSEMRALLADKGSDLNDKFRAAVEELSSGPELSEDGIWEELLRSDPYALEHFAPLGMRPVPHFYLAVAAVRRLAESFG